MKTVFITRRLSEKSIFKQHLESAGMKIFGESLIQFSAVPFDELPEGEWIFFFSKNGVKFFFQGVEQSDLEIPENIKWAAIGPETAAALSFELKTPDFIGNGNAEETADSFLKMAKGQTVIFPQAEASLRTIQQNLGKAITAVDLVVYKNTPKKLVDIPACDYVALTSPLNARVYLDKVPLKANQKLFAIGQTTANLLIESGIDKFEIAAIPSEEGLAKVILKSLKSGG